MFVGLVLGFLFYSIGPCIFFVPIPCCLDDYSFVVEAKVWDCDASCIGFLLQYYFGYSGSFVVPINFRIVCSSSGVIFIGIALNV